MKRNISKAPLPSIRYRDFFSINHPRKVVTIEPVMDFNTKQFLNWMVSLKNAGQLEYVYLGYNSRPKPKLIEPSENKLRQFIQLLWEKDIEVKDKKLRNLKDWFEKNNPFLEL